MKILFLMDPLETVNPVKDTTLALMLGARRHGHETFYLPRGGVSLRDGQVVFRTEKVLPKARAKETFQREGKRVLRASEADILFVRTDPPFDTAYLTETWLLDRLPEGFPVLNRPAGLRAVNEKIWATRFPELHPPTWVTRNREDFAAFLDQHGDIILKPTDSFGGKSVFHLRRGDDNAFVAFESVSDSGSRDVILQRFLPEAARGDKRILLLNGEPLGAVSRVHRPGDHRNNFFAGGQPEPTEISPRDRQIIETLRPDLRRLGLYFVGIDIIGDYLVEVNVTSPTCLQEMNRITGKNLEDEVISFAEGLLAPRTVSRWLA